MMEPDLTTHIENMVHRPFLPSLPSEHGQAGLSHRWTARFLGFMVGTVFFVLVIAPDWVLDSAMARQIGTSKIERIDGSSINGEILSIDSEGNVIGDGIPDGLKLLDILSIQTERTTQSNSDATVTIYPVSGGQLKVSDPTISEEKTRFQSAFGPRELPLQSVRAIVWKTSPAVVNAINEPSTDNDKVIVDTDEGDRVVEGILEAIDSEYVQINYKGESRKISLEKIKAVISADLGLATPTGATAAIDLVDGSQVMGVISELTDGVLQVKIVGDASLPLKSEIVVNITIRSDRMLYLSDTQPVDVQEKSLFAIQRSWMRDRSVENTPLRIGLNSSGNTIGFKKGLGTQAFCRLEFANTNQFDRFSAVVGIDAETAGRGDCQVVVRGDGIELWSQRVRATDEPHRLNVDIEGFKKIALIVYPGEEFDLGDHLDWGDARFLKTK